MVLKYSFTHLKDCFLAIQNIININWDIFWLSFSNLLPLASYFCYHGSWSKGDNHLVIWMYLGIWATRLLLVGALLGSDLNKQN